MSTSGRDHAFPATSIGRSAAVRVERNTSHDSMASHPLLSPSTSSAAGPLVSNASIGVTSGGQQNNQTQQPQHTQSVPLTATQLQQHRSSHTSHAQPHHHQQQANGHTGGLNAPRYVPYTPRHRASPTATTSFASGIPTHSQIQTAGHAQYQSHHQQNQSHAQPRSGLGDVTTRLQMTKLKAAVHDIGLDMGSVGWAILERLIGMHTVHDGWTGEGSEWEEIWRLITTEKATLLLPVDQLHPSERITTEFIKDHVVLCDTPSRSGSQIVTLSGLRGVLEGDKLVFRSSISPASKLFQSLLLASTRPEALSRLPPLPKSAAIPPTPPNPTTPTSSNENASNSITPTRLSTYPTFTIPALTTLPVPPRHTILSSLAASHPSTSSLASSASSATAVGSPSTAYPPSSKSFLPPRMSARSSSNSSTHSAPGGLQVQTGPIALQTANSQGGSASGTPLMSTSRLPNPFASLFGRNGAIQSPSTPPPQPHLQQLQPSSQLLRTETPPPASPVHGPQPSRAVGVRADGTLLNMQEVLDELHAKALSRLPIPGISSTGECVSSSVSTGSTGTMSTTTSTTPAGTTATGRTHTHVDISVLTIEKRILRREVGRAMNRVLRGEVKAGLISERRHENRRSEGSQEMESQDKSADSEIQSPGQVAGSSGSANAGQKVQVPSWVIERVHEFTADWYPVVKGPLQVGIFGFESSGGSPPTVNGPNGIAHTEKGYIANMIEETPEEIVEKLQDFYLWLEEDLERIEGDGGFKKKWMNVSSAGGGSGRATPTPGEEKENDELMESVLTLVPDDRGTKEGRRKIRDIVEVVERTVCELFYDRLFMQPTSDDGSHDEALSSRVAALNMLDLGLEHLDVIVSEKEGQKEKVGEVVKACGELLGQLEDCYCPADKAAVLVQAHKVVVDGLSKLPPVRLKSDEEKEAEKAKKAEEAQATPKARRTRESVTENGKPSHVPAVLEEDKEKVTIETQPLLQGDGSQEEDEDAQSVSTGEADTLPSAPASSDDKPRQHEPTPVSGDVLLPMIIFSVVKANPNRLVSNLLFTQRFRNQAVVGNGEESYCLINLMAVAEFLENVDLEGLGLTGEGRGKVISAADLKPIPITRSPRIPSRPLTPVANQIKESVSFGALGRLRGRVEQQVDALAGSANQVLTGVTGVVDTSFGLLRSFLPGGVSTDVVAPGMDPTQGSAPWNAPARTTVGGLASGFGLLRRESGFSIASIAASLPGTASLRGKGSTPGSVVGGMGGGGGGVEEVGQQMVAVSRGGPSSLRSRSLNSFRIRVRANRLDEDGGSEGVVSESDEGENESGRDDDGLGLLTVGRGGGAGQADTRSITSFESMLNGRRKGGSNLGSTASYTPPSGNGTPRKNLTDRLASVSGLKGTSTPGSSRPSSPAPGSLLFPAHSMIHPHPTLTLAPPNQHFLESSAGDLKISEVKELLKEYRRLVEGVRSVGGFIEEERN
ncbi:hypothetical protein BDN72DRAFT_842723 [Pluteus cervinus]|uniref:Uncharacterized protein n=1 Tax=Pluteus cervinus TaxID=181527 RepID=A0ACD3APZ9_9AGAR|nr:hypothetical protein BDN72DRAFT_842723 [Pluteus cervinus]